MQMHTEKFNEKSLNNFLAKSSIAVALKCCCCKDTHISYFSVVGKYKVFKYIPQLFILIVFQIRKCTQLKHMKDNIQI